MSLHLIKQTPSVLTISHLYPELSPLDWVLDEVVNFK